MPSISDNQPGQKLNNQPINRDAATNTQKNSQVEVKIKILKVNVFFDGTLNNMFNSNLRTDSTDTTTQQEMSEQGSYENDLSNVALLYMASTQTDGKTENIYIPGAGTFTMDDSTYEKDSLFPGAAMGEGGSGVTERVKKALNDLKTKAQKAKAKRIFINVFGFSRGSFYARHFCFKLKDRTTQTTAFVEVLSSPFEIPGVAYNNIKINFVGIFDTVSSEGMNHYNDVKEWGLDIGGKQGIEHILHLTAQDEYRYHFPLTHITTAMNETNSHGDLIGFECSFPGAHSDIGGSYYENYPEPSKIPEVSSSLHPSLENKPTSYKYISVLDEERDSSAKINGEISWKWFQEKGYYRGIPTSKNPIDWREFFVFEGPFAVKYQMTAPRKVKMVCVKHITRNKTYQFILANIMKEAAEKIVTMTFKGKFKKKLEDGIALMKRDEILSKINDHAHKIIFDNYKIGKSCEVSLNDAGLSPTQQQELYHDYLHNSLAPDQNPIYGGNTGISGQTNPPKRNHIKG